MNRILGIDLGQKRTGFAVSDELRISSRPYRILTHETMDEVVLEIEKITALFSIKTIVLGDPRSILGEETIGSQRTNTLKKLLIAKGFEVHLVDERNSSKEAENSLHGNKKVNKSSRMVDAEAAKIILDRYLRMN